jgi:tetratricopeptide (TPR) repeat protein
MTRRLTSRAWLLVAVLSLAACATERGSTEVYSGPQPAPPPPPSPMYPQTNEVAPPTAAEYPAAPAAPVPVVPVTPEMVNVPPPPVLPTNFPRTIEESGTGRAVLALYSQAQQARQSAQLPRADALLERALRIEARNAWVWQALASVHMAMKEVDQAENEARKSNSLARGNPYITAANWRLIAASRQTRGDAAGAQNASLQADELTRRLQGQ